jgi:predicted glycosyltransferase involved in capsule biosynthesis
MTSLQMPDILCATYEIPTKKSPEYTIYDIQNTLLISLILITLEQSHHYLLQDKAYAWDQYKTLKQYFDLGQHSQCYYAIKEIYTYRYTTKEAALTAINVFNTRLRETNVRTID